ncbi:hypothetical protein K2173_004321 [Erythroxylum novogranatense]|uniref:Protein kinase domain-containing protein n=1 Tax=Erythroxylum novogranatense TaxID=1862640 RepID=A0AAV8U3V4_9ROSI|nr:hypothetical protein K2173_004321 [Erythroxylum novogranatense]
MGFNSKKAKQSFFLTNGGKMLEQIITGFDGKCNPIRSFTEEELKRATNNYSEDGILREDLYHTLNKGVHEGRQVSVKKFKSTSKVEWIINEISVASFMSNHRNMFKLLGCCLETELPILVYEYASKGVLSNYIVAEGNDQEFSWETKLKIVTGIANAVSYLHYGSSKVILHRNINTTNVILHEDYTGKLMDFQLAIPIPAGENHVDTEEFCGIAGYVAPEIFLMGRYTEKCDVYSFGVIVLELLTGKRVRQLQEDESFGTTSASFSRLLRDSSGCLDEWDKFFENKLKDVLEREHKKQAIQCVDLTLRCLRKDPDKRPTMKEVAQALSCIKRLQEP